MKNILVSIFLFFTLGLSAQQGLIDQAKDFYTQEKYEEAVLMYDSIIALGVSSSELYYNMGNAHYKLGHIAQCILFYERALQLSPNDEDVMYNLELVQQHVVDEIDIVDEFFLKKSIRSLRMSSSSDDWAKISLICFSVGLILLLVFFLSHITLFKKIAFYLSLAVILFSILSLSFSLKNKNEMTSRDSAIIFVPTVTVKSSPNKNGTQIFVLHEGTKVKITDSIGEWVEIKLADGNKGWIMLETIEKI